MPGFDGTGPRGMGPLTGRGMGYCAVPLTGITPLTGYPPLSYYTPVSYRLGPPLYGYPYGPQRVLRAGRGRSTFFRGRGRGRRRMW
jgi:hypothetical protein